MQFSPKFVTDEGFEEFHCGFDQARGLNDEEFF